MDNSWQLLALPLLLIVVPIVMLYFQISPGELVKDLKAEMVIRAVWISLRTIVISLVVTVLTGMPLAYLLSHQHFAFKKVVDTTIDLPTVLPPSVAGIALLITLGRKGLIGGWLDVLGVHIAFTAARVIFTRQDLMNPTIWFYPRKLWLIHCFLHFSTIRTLDLGGLNVIG